MSCFARLSEVGPYESEDARCFGHSIDSVGFIISQPSISRPKRQPAAAFIEVLPRLVVFYTATGPNIFSLPNCDNALVNHMNRIAGLQAVSPGTNGEFCEDMAKFDTPCL